MQIIIILINMMWMTILFVIMVIGRIPINTQCNLATSDDLLCSLWVPVGLWVGVIVGNSVGLAVGFTVGISVGEALGIDVWHVGLAEGGAFGANVGLIGLAEGHFKMYQ